MENNEIFLKKYKELENAILNIGETSQDDSPIFWYENKIKDTEKQNKLRLCRTARNFLQHNDNGNFFEATTGMILFLEKITDEVSSQFVSCQEKMTKAVQGKTLVETKSKIFDCLKSLEKNKALLVFDGNKLKGLFTTMDYLKASTKTKLGKTSKIDKFLTPVKEAYLSKNSKYDEALKLIADSYSIVLITDTGKKTGKLLGYII